MKARVFFCLVLLMGFLVLSLGGSPTTKAQKPEPQSTPIATPTPPLELKRELEYRPAAMGSLSAPPNDDFNAALLITTLPYQHSLDTRAATVAPDDPNMGCGAGVNSNTVWYRFIPSFYGFIEANTFGSNYDTVLAIFTGARGALNRLTCNDDASGSVQSQVIFEVIPNQTYYLEVADYGSPGGGELHLTLRADPLLFVNSPTDLYVLNLTTGSVTHIGSFGTYGQMTDIAFLGNKLYGVSFDTLYSISPSDGHAIAIGNIGYSSVNSLEAINNTLYAATGDREFLRVNEMTGQGTLVGRFPSGQTPAGDLAFLSGTLYIVFDGSPDRLGTVNPSDGSTSIVGSIGYEGVLGLAGVGSSLYGVTEDYGRILRIDISTGTGYETGYYIGSGDRFWGMTGYANTAPTSNDDFDHADELAEPPPNGLANQILDTDTNDATVAPDDPDMGCGAGVNSHTLWYKLVPSYYGRVRLRTYSTLDPNASSNYDTVLAVFTGQRGSLNRIACNDDAPGYEPLSDLTFEAEAGKTYYIEVASYDSTPGGVLSLFVNYEVSPKAWTLMFYFAANNDLEGALKAERDSLVRAAKNLNVNIVALWDDNLNLFGSKYLVFTPYGTEEISKPELNTGNPSTLSDFLSWAIHNHPANHYALVINNHGQGFSGTSVDNYSGGDWLNMQEMSQALVGIYPKPDIIYMDACLMGTIESAYQLAFQAAYYVASESLVYGPKRLDCFVLGSRACGLGSEILPIRGDTSSEELAMSMAESYVLQYRNLPGTISVIRLSDVTDVAMKASNLAGLLKSRMSSVRSTLSGIWDDVQRFDQGDDLEITTADMPADLYHFAYLVQHRISDLDIRTAAGQLMDAIGNALQFEEHWSGSYGQHHWNHENSHGISVFLPPPTNRECYYNGAWLDFAYGTDWQCQGLQLGGLSVFTATLEWGPMLVEYLNQTNPSAPENPNPPVPVPMLANYNLYLPLILRSFGGAPSPTPTPTPTPTPPPSGPIIRVEPTSGPLGTRFNIYGSGFVAGESVQQWVILPSGDRFDDPTPETVDSQGNYTSWIQIDYGPTGIYTLYARGNQSQQTVSTQFQITSSGTGGVESSKLYQIVWSR
ncbi:clostripain-related cysteine peptidase [Caldilinea sp.]|uniref:clostripain-related cysteine peptidase n=1 Tax=Caldilinea sp. TaxID=2293560 RepID=UPI0021DBDB7D|nr:clostripain-related cysteine peptidase [Caldilinea sp.]GIV70075.1 MAG: hypothetical protein KatS3mg048_2937 [Caldilinea sp.]